MGDRDIVKNEIERVYKRKRNGEEKEVVVPKTASDLQKMQLERLMADPERPVEIPEQKKKWQPRAAPEFVRHVMGSSAGAGSGEFHVYRGLRRREMNRVDFIEHQAEEEKLDEEYQAKLQQNKEAAESKTAKKRAKRQRKKQKQGLVKKAKTANSSGNVAAEHDDAANGEESESGSDEEPHFVIGGK